MSKLAAPLLAMLLLVAAGPCHAESAESLEDRILAAIAHGQPIDHLIAALPERQPERSSQAKPISLGADLHEALTGGTRAEILAAHDAVLSHFSDTKLEISELGLPEIALSRLAEARRSYLAQIEPVLESLEHDQDRAKSLIADLPLDQPQPILRALPYRRAGLAPREPSIEPEILPSYRDPAAAEPASADYAGTDEAPLDPEILTRAQDLGYNVIEIREYVRNQIRTEWYAGSQKGALGTLRQGSGNHLDQASLLIALLRASQVASRYVHGVIELPIGQVATDLGLRDPSQVPAALARAGVAMSPIVQGGQIAAVQVESTWVSAYVPYGNYRGAVVDFSGRTWLPMAPGIKGMTDTQPTAILRTMAFDPALFVDAYLATVQSVGPLDQVRDLVETFLIDNDPDATYSEQLGSREISTEILGLLPSTLPCKVVAATEESPTLSAGYQVSMQIIVHSGVSEGSPVVLDGTLPISQVAGHRLTLSYIPATVEDHDITNAFGGLSGVPLYLIRLRPQIKVDGQPSLVASGDMAAGVNHLLEIVVSGPAGTARTSQAFPSAAYHAMGIGARVPAQLPPDESLTDTEPIAASLLAGAAIAFEQAWTDAEDELADLYDVSVVRPLPSAVLVTDVVEVVHVMDLPFSLKWKGVSFDAALRIAEPLTRGSDPSAEHAWMRLAALEGSSLEHRVFESRFLVESISADKGLGLARDLGVEVVHLDGVSDPDLVQLDLSAEIEAAIDNWLRLGMTVDVPVVPISLNIWTGSTWRVSEPETGSAGYFISGELAGGSTAEDPDAWPLDFVADALEAPYSRQPNRDPMAGVEIAKLPWSDRQHGKVGEIFPIAMYVEVRDDRGRPVVKAEVTFRVDAGLGEIVDWYDQPREEITVQTDSLGRASIRFRSGIRTDAEPFLAFESPGDEHLSRALSNQIDVWAASRIGLLFVESPFELLGFPGAPVAQRSTKDTFQLIGENVGFKGPLAGVFVEDTHGNPISNLEAEFWVGPPLQSPFCPPSDYQPPEDTIAAIYDPVLDDDGNLVGCVASGDSPFLGECGWPSLIQPTTIQGASIGTILGYDDALIYTFYSQVRNHPEVPEVFFTVHPFFGCDGIIRSPETDLVWSGHLTDFKGNNINAAALGQTFLRPIEVRPVCREATVEDTELYRTLGSSDRCAEGPAGCCEVGPGCTDIGVQCPPNTDPPCYQTCCGRWRVTEWGPLRWVGTTANLTFEVDSGGSASAPTAVIAGPNAAVYDTQITVGNFTSEDKVTASGTIKDWYWTIDPMTGEIIHDSEDVDYPYVASDITFDKSDSVFAVVPSISSLTPQVVELDDSGRTTTEVWVSYSILPPDYVAAAVEVDIFAGDELVGSGLSPQYGGNGQVTIQRGFPFDIEKTNEVVLVLNRGTAAEVRSLPVEIPLTQRIIRSVSSTSSFKYRVESPRTDGVIVKQEVDLVNNSYCPVGTEFFFTLDRESTVSLTFSRIDAVVPGGEPVLGEEIVLIDDELLVGEIQHRRMITPFDLLPGQYQFDLVATATVDGAVDTHSGRAISIFEVHDSLPVGHAMQEGVDLFDGHLIVSREDLAVPGRGPSLSFARTFSSNGAEIPGELGVRWSHSYQSKVTLTRCGDFIVQGGEGSGMRFTPDDEDGLTPQKGFHGSLVSNSEDHSVDFFAKSGTRYHYAFDLFQQHWGLEYIEDSNGNRTTLFYTGEASGRRLTTVRDSAGRTLSFTYELHTFGSWTGYMISHVDGPDEMSVTYTYDGWGNLVSAVREALLAESYTYEAGGDFPLTEPHQLTTVTNDITGAVTSYTYDHAPIGIQGDVEVESLFVSTLTRPEGGVVAFDHDTTALGSRDPPTLETVVTDARGKQTTYFLNQYGSPLEITDAEANTTSMTWAPDDIVMDSRTDANGYLTGFTYDEHGNPLTETITIQDADDNDHTYTTRKTYWSGTVQAGPGESPVLLEPRYIKNLLKTSTDREGAITRYYYDSHGNLTWQEVDVTGIDGVSSTLVTRYIYDERGDRRYTVDPRGKVSYLEYDAYGNISLLRQENQGHRIETTSTWDVRSRLNDVTNARGATTTFEYDTLGRATAKILPIAAGEAAAPSETIEYRDAERQVVTTDAESRTLTESYDLEGRVVVVLNPEGATKVMEHDLEGNKTLESNWFDSSTTRYDTDFGFDDSGRLVRTTEPLDRETVFAYDGVGNVTTKTLSDLDISSGFEARIAHHEYDGLNRRIRTTRETTTGPVISTLYYDGEGRTVLERDALDRETEHRYDQAGRLIETIGPEWRAGHRRTSEMLYDGNGNLFEERLINQRLDEEGTFVQRDQIRRREYDDLNRLHLQYSAKADVSVFTYDDVGNLIQLIDGRQNLTEHQYDARRRRVKTTSFLTRVTLPLPRQVVTRFSYDAVGNLVSEDLPNGNFRIHEYDGLNRLELSFDLVGRIVVNTYDTNGNVIEQRDPNNNLTVNHYDALNRLVQQDLPEGRIVESGYDVAGNQISVTDARDNTTTSTYDRLNRLVKVVDPPVTVGTYETSFTYDAVGNRRTETDRRGNTTTFDYDDLNRLVKTTTPPVEPTDEVYETSITYDAAGNQLSVTDRRGFVTESSYDSENRVLDVFRDGVRLSTSGYDEVGNVVSSTDANGHTTSFVYDERNLLMVVNRPEAAITRYTLDDMGDVVLEKDPEQHETTRTYDLRQRLGTEKNAEQETTTFEYDGNGNRTATIRPKAAGNLDLFHWRFEFDGADRLVKVTDPLTHETAYGYDDSSNVTTRTDAEQKTSTLVYDELNRLSATIYAGNVASQTYSYDPNGNRRQLTDANGQIVDSVFDSLNREILRTYSTLAPIEDAIQSMTFTYDQNNNLRYVVESYNTGDQETDLHYDHFDRLEDVTDRFGNKIGYIYDNNGNRTFLTEYVTDPGGATTQYHYDDLNRLKTVTLPGAGVATYQYYRNSLLKDVEYPNLSKATYRYDDANRVLQIDNELFDGSLVSSFGYIYDDNGNRETQTEVNGGGAELTTYVYDAADRLTEVQYPASITTTYGLDGVGNRITETTVDGATTTMQRVYDYDDRHRLWTINDAVDEGNNISYGYDANGNQIARTKGDVTTEFRYDVRDQVVELWQEGSRLGQFGYDYRGLRVAKLGLDGLLNYVYDGSSAFLQTNAIGDPVAKYEYGPDRLLSVNHFSEGRSFYLFDALGSVVNLVDAAGSIQARYQYDAWGNYRATAGSRWNPFGFTGHEYDEETDLYYAKARFYDPEVGRFLTRDPAQGEMTNPPSFHLYLYAYSNPTVYWDPSGLSNESTATNRWENEEDIPVGTSYRKGRDNSGNWIYYDMDSYAWSTQDAYEHMLSRTRGQELLVKEEEESSGIGGWIKGYLNRIRGVKENYDECGVTLEKNRKIREGRLSVADADLEVTLDGGPFQIGAGSATEAGKKVAASLLITTVIVLDDASMATGVGKLASKAIIKGVRRGIRYFVRNSADELVELTVDPDGILVSHGVDEATERAVLREAPGSAALTQTKPNYTQIPDPQNVTASTKPTPRQVREMKRLNMEHNNGVLRDDVTGELMEPSSKSVKGVTPSPKEVQVDHKVPKDKGGTRAMDNLELRTRANNREKWNK